MLMIVCNQPQLRPCAIVCSGTQLHMMQSYLSEVTFVVSGNESQNVFMPQHHRLVNFGLTEPRALFARAENLYGHILTPPSASPNLAEPSLAYDVNKLDLPGNGALHQKRQT